MDLWYAIKHSLVVDVRRLVKTQDPNVRNDDGYTALMMASHLGVLDIVQILFENGADVNARSDSGNTALILAAKYNHPAVVFYLLQQGADANAAVNGVTALQHAAWADNRTIMLYIFAHGGASTINKKNDRRGRTALHFAAVKNNETAIQLLLDRGASKTIKDNSGKTPLDLAIAQGHTNLIPILSP
jgi:ankyrin repeat protein